MQSAFDESVRRLIAIAKEEDLGAGDLSAGLLPDPSAPAEFRLLGKQDGVVAGVDIAQAVLATYDAGIEIEWHEGIGDGTVIDAVPVTLATIRGPLGAVLSAERVLLNFLQRLCGIATVTRRYVDAVAGTSAAVYDTRKTTPGWRTLEKYAVRCGGGRNHRQGLYDAVLIKDNHLAGIEPSRLAGVVFEMLNKLGEQGAEPAFIEVEADTLVQMEQLLKVVGIDVILLDNFSDADSVTAVRMRDDAVANIVVVYCVVCCFLFGPPL